MIKETDPILLALRKKIPDYNKFKKDVEIYILNDFDKTNDNFQLIPKYSKEYYLLREFLLKSIVTISIRNNRFRKIRFENIKKLRNYQKYLKNEIESTETDIEGIS